MIVAPARFIALEAPSFSGDAFSATRSAFAVPNAYALVQVERSDAIILTYSCDIDRGLENIALGGAPDVLELITITAVRPIGADLQERVKDIETGRMPRYALIPSTNEHAHCVIDFSSIQQISLRVLVPLAVAQRKHAMTGDGQKRVLERMAHALGDVFRRMRGNDDVDNTLLQRAHEKLRQLQLPLQP